jgi:sialate O-acetylesterase
MNIDTLLSKTALACGIIASIQLAQASVITDVSESGDYLQVYKLDIPTNVDYNGSTPDYDINYSSGTVPGGIERISYYMELQKSGGERQWIWASFDTYTQDLRQMGVPVAGKSIWDETLSNMNIETNVSGIVSGSGISTGNIEFWSNCYSTENDSGIPNSNSKWDWDADDTIKDGESCYGSMQIHNYGADQTLFAWNSWAGSGASDLGIGNGPGNNTDWTSAGNAADYSLKSLEVWVQPSNEGVTSISEPASLAILGLGLVGLGVRRFKKKANITA